MRPRILDELAKTAAACYDRISNENRARLWIAVTAEEYEEIRQYCFKKYGVFFGRILNIPIFIAGDPLAQTEVMQYGPPEPHHASSEGHEEDSEHPEETSGGLQRLLDHSETPDTRFSRRLFDTPDREPSRNHSTDDDASDEESATTRRR